MEPIKINISTPVNSFKSVNIEDMIERDNELLIKLKNKECYHVYEGQELSFVRYVYTSGNSFYTLSQKVNVIKEDDDHTIHTTLLPINKVFLEKDWYFNPKKDEFSSFKLVSGVTETENGEEENYVYHIIKTQDKHNIFPQDLTNNLQEITIKDINGKTLAVYSGTSINIPLKIGDRSVFSGDCLTEISNDETCGKRFKRVITYQYDFLPNKVDMNALLISGFSEHIVSEMAYLETKFNPFYYYYINCDDEGNPNEFDEYGNVVKHCRLYQDPWWPEYDNKNRERKGFFYLCGGESSTELGYNTYYWNVDVGLSSSTDESTLGSSDNFNTKFVKDLEDSLIPAVIDMERVKYSPMVYDSEKENVIYYKWVSNNDKAYNEVYTKEWIHPSVTEDWSLVDVYRKDNTEFLKIDKEFIFDAANAGGYNIFRSESDQYTHEETTFVYHPTDEIINSALTIATSVTFNFHFRKRHEINTDDEDLEYFLRKRNTPLTSGNVYSDGWYINPDSGDTIWWNGLNCSDSAFSETVSNFINASGSVSDLLGYLNFVDNDVYYRKKKVSQSFVRLTFYTSKDPIEQKILFHSTIFLDGGGLYRKYIKQRMFMEENDLFNEKKYGKINRNVAVLLCSADTKSSIVDTKLVVTNEYDRTKSSEGFNLYLFAEDHNFNIENGRKTIYMKVEFNHAGNGKTIPMIMWPKDKNGKYIALTMNNFIENLYIPINLTYINDRFVYYIPNAFKNENGNIELVLFEPKIDYPDDVPEDYE